MNARLSSPKRASCVFRLHLAAPVPLPHLRAGCTGRRARGRGHGSQLLHAHGRAGHGGVASVGPAPRSQGVGRDHGPRRRRLLRGAHPRKCGINWLGCAWISADGDDTLLARNQDVSIDLGANAFSEVGTSCGTQCLHAEPQKAAYLHQAIPVCPPSCPSSACMYLNKGHISTDGISDSWRVAATLRWLPRQD